MEGYKKGFEIFNVRVVYKTYSMDECFFSLGELLKIYWYLYDVLYESLEDVNLHEEGDEYISCHI